jgi:hypothetical protein
MKIADKTTGIILLILFCGLFLGGLAGSVDKILYLTIGVEDSITVQDLSKIQNREFMLSYTYLNKIKSKSYTIRRSIGQDEYERIKNKTRLKVRYVGYFPMSPYIEGVDSNLPNVIAVFGLILLAFGIRRTVLFLKGKIKVN